MSDTLPIHFHVEDLAREYLRRETAGELVRGTRWLESALACPGTPPASAVAIVTSYAVVSLAAAPESARFVVVFQRAGFLDRDASGQRYRPDPAVEHDTLLLVQRRYGWRVAATPPHQHLTPTAALAVLPLPSAVRVTLRGLARR